MIATQAVPLSQERSNFRHMVMDILWYGLALPATSRFLQVYAIRLGADATELTWLASLPAIVLLLSASLASWWMGRYNGDARRATIWPGVGQRLAFLLPALTPFMPARFQPIWLILALTLPAIPQGIASVTFTVMFRECVNEQMVVPLNSRRWLTLNAALSISGLAMGFWLERVPFPFNYQAIFVLAFILSMVSFWHVWSVRLGAPSLKPSAILKAVNPLRDPNFQRVAFVVTMMYLSFCSVNSLVSLHLVKHLGAGEVFIGGPFALAELLAGAGMALCAKNLIDRLSSRLTMGLAMVGTSAGVMLMAVAPNLYVALIASALTGASWTGANIALFAFFTENTPKEQMTRYTTVYNQVLFLASFLGPFIGNGLVDLRIPLVSVLLIGGALRLVASFCIQSHLLERFGRSLGWASLTR